MQDASQKLKQPITPQISTVSEDISVAENNVVDLSGEDVPLSALTTPHCQQPTKTKRKASAQNSQTSSSAIGTKETTARLKRSIKQEKP